MLADMQRLSNQLDVLLQRYTREHPDAVAVISRMAALDDELKRVPKFLADSESAPFQNIPRQNTATQTDSAHGSAPTDGAGPRLAGQGDEPTLSGDTTAPPASAADRADQEAEDAVRIAWDRSQEELQKCVRAEQQALDREDELRRQGGALSAPGDDLASAAEHDRSSIDNASAGAAGPAGWSLAAALASLLGLEAVALRVATSVVSLEQAAPLLTVDSVAALLPIPVLAVVPASGGSLLNTEKTRSDASWLVFWLLACEGTLAAMAFLLTALTVHDLHFPIEIIQHPIGAMARGLHGLHS